MDLSLLRNAVFTAVVLVVMASFLQEAPRKAASVYEASLPQAAPEPLQLASTTPLASASSTGPAAAFAATSTAPIATSTIPGKALSVKRARTSREPVPLAALQPAAAASSRVAAPIPRYATPPLSVEAANAAARAALVNIFCTSDRGSINPTSASGVIIDPRGIILTNAHVAQYVLLAEDPRIDLSCVARAGAPAEARWDVEVLYMPPVWVSAHAAEITQRQTMGTGEHDWALLRITGTRGRAHMPTSFPYLPADTRDSIWAVGDQVLVASYPAEFVGGFIAQNNLFPVTSITVLRQLLTFSSTTVDALSLGGVIGAQGGSSGGAVVNAWGRLVGLITTTSTGKTTADRDLHAITLDYIDRDIRAQTGLGLAQFLEGNLAATAADFAAHTAPGLIGQFLKQLER